MLNKTEIEQAFQRPLSVIRKIHSSQNRICVSQRLQISSKRCQSAPSKKSRRSGSTV